MDTTALLSILKSKCVDAGSKPGSLHTLHSPLAHWNIQHGQHMGLWRDYCDLIYSRRHLTKSTICLAEAARPVMPVVADLIFRYDLLDDESEWEMYNDRAIQAIVCIYQLIMEEKFKIDELCNVAVILESANSWVETDTHKNEQVVQKVRIQFPFAKIDMELQRKILRPLVLAKLREHSIKGLLDREPIGDWDLIIPERGTSDPLVMYGSTETPDQEILRAKYSLSYVCPDAIFDDQYHAAQLPPTQLFDYDQHIHIRDQFSPEDLVMFKAQNGDLQYILPLYLSADFRSIVIQPKETTLSGAYNVGYSPQAAFGDNRDRTQKLEPWQVAESMLNLINPARYLQAGFWRDIGEAISHTYNNTPLGLNVLIQRTLAAVQGRPSIPSFMLEFGNIQDTCMNLYSTYNNTKTTVKTLGWYAREDNLIDYDDWHSKVYMGAMELAVENPRDHTYIMRAFKQIYWLDYICEFTGGGNGNQVRWYKFKGHKWHECTGGAELRNEMSDDFRGRFIETANKLGVLMERANRGAGVGVDRQTDVMKKIWSLIGALGLRPFKAVLLQQAADEFYMEGFSATLDTKLHLTGVTNGVIEIVDGKATKRDGKPEDYIHMTTSVPLRTDFTWSSPQVVQNWTWLEQVFPDRELRRYFLKYCASFLIGGNLDKKLAIFTGNGHNSKSMIIKMFEAIFGPYCVKIPVEQLTQKAVNASSASPQLARTANTRICCLDEPDGKTPISSAEVKLWTGGDRRFTRGLYKEGGETTATYKTVLICNKIPSLSEVDPAILDRIMIIPFLSKWLREMPADMTHGEKKKFFLMDQEFDRKIPMMAAGFMWIIFQYYVDYHEEKLNKVPDIVKQHHEEYVRDNDQYANFISEKIDLEKIDGKPNPNIKISTQTIVREYKNWHRQNFRGMYEPQPAEIKAAFSREDRWRQPEAGFWYGAKLRVEEASGVKNNLIGREAAPIIQMSLAAPKVTGAPAKPTSTIGSTVNNGISNTGSGIGLPPIMLPVTNQSFSQSLINMLPSLI